MKYPGSSQASVSCWFNAETLIMHLFHYIGVFHVDSSKTTDLMQSKQTELASLSPIGGMSLQAYKTMCTHEMQML